MDVVSGTGPLLRRVARAALTPLLASSLGLVTGATPPVDAGSAQPAAHVIPGPVSQLRPSAGVVKPLPDVRAAAATASSRTVLLGAWVKPREGQTHQQAVAGLETDIGRRLSVDHVYHGWDSPLIGPYERWSAARGHILLINWKAVHETWDGKSDGNGAGYVRWADIAAGRYDADVIARAREIKRFKKVVYLNFHHEPEDDRDISGQRRAGTPADYRAAWRHIRSVFRRERVQNVRFVMILMGWTFHRGLAGQWYPGRSVVDVVGADAYNWFGTAHPGANSWTTFESAFQAAYRFADSKGKPLWVTETGVQEDPARPGRKAAWYRSVAAAAEKWPALGGVVFFMGGRYGWYPDSSKRSLAAFRALGQDPLFS